MMAAPSVGKNAKQRSASITSMAPFDTRLRSAVIAADVGLVERLLEDPEARKILRQPRIVFSTTVQSSTLEKASKNPDLLNLFLKAGANPNFVTSYLSGDFKPLLWHCAALNYAKSCQLLLRYGADIDQIGWYGKHRGTPLEVAEQSDAKAAYEQLTMFQHRKRQQESSLSSSLSALSLQVQCLSDQMNGSIGSDGVSSAAKGVATTTATATTAGSAAASGTASLRAQRENLLEQLRHINEEISASGEIDDPPLYEETVEN